MPALRQLLPWPRAGEHRTFWGVACLLILSAAVQAMAEVQATSLLADTSGTRGVLLLWAVEALVTWFGIAALAPWLDRVEPRRLAVVVAALLAALLAAVALGARAAPAPGWWVALGLLNGLQADLLVLAGWTLARDAWTEEQGTRLFGPLSSLAFVGTIGGSAFASVVAGRLAGWQLVLGAAALLLLVLVVALWLFPSTPHHVMPAAPSQTEALRWMWSTPLFRRLSLLQLGNGAAWTALSLVTVLALQLDAGGEDALQRSYGGLRTAAPVVNAFIHATVATAALQRLGYGVTLLFAPVWLVCGLALLVWSPVAAAAWVASLGLQVAFGVEGAALQVVVLRADTALRGRVGAVLTGQLPQLGYLLGCGILAAVDLATDRGLPQLQVRWLAGCGLALAGLNLMAAAGLRTFAGQPAEVARARQPKQ